MNGDSYRLKQSKHRPRADDQPALPPKPNHKTQEGLRAGAFLCLLLIYFCSGVPTYFYSGVDSLPYLPIEARIHDEFPPSGI
jgi:hypothetical protein